MANFSVHIDDKARKVLLQEFDANNLTPNNVGTVTYTCSDPSFATVDSTSGAITPLQVTTADLTLTGTDTNGQTNTCTLAITAVPPPVPGPAVSSKLVVI